MDIDALYDNAVAYVLKHRDRSCSGLQRHLRIGYTTAKQLQERLEKSGVYSGIEGEMEPEHVVIKVVGIGGAGCNALEELVRMALPGVESIAVNVDAQGLARSSAHKVIRIGARGYDRARTSNFASDLAQQCRDQLADALRGAHIAVIAAGIGGSTGGGVAPVIAQIAKEQGSVCLGVAFVPWEVESEKHHLDAGVAVQALSSFTDSLFVVQPPALDSDAGKKSVPELLRSGDTVLYEIVEVLARMFSGNGNLPPSFFDLKGVLGKHGKAMIGTGHASGPERARIATELACAALSDRGVNTRDARGLLVIVTAGRNSRLVKPSHVMEVAASFFAPDVSLLMSYVLDDAMHDQLRVTLVVTGMSPK